MEPRNRQRRLLRFVASYIIVGVFVATAIVWYAPGWLAAERPVVEIQEASPAAASNGTVPAQGPFSYARAVERAAPAVVNVYSAKATSRPRHPFFNDPRLERFFGDEIPQPEQRTETSLGSGVIFSADGYVLTNNHVIQDATQIQILLADGRTAAAQVVGSDPESDLAVLRIRLDELPTVTVGDSQTVEVGDVVLAIGNPFGVGQTVTQGIVSATGRSRLGLATFENFIQTDAAINPGNSGGALINARGELVGINTAIYSRSGGSLGIGFAIPAGLASGVLRSIVENGRVIRGWMGIQAQDVTPELADTFGLDKASGVLIAGVLRGGPADTAGLVPGDIVLELDRRPVTAASDLRRQVTAKPPGSEVTVSGLREGEPFEHRVRIEERPTELGRSGDQ